MPNETTLSTPYGDRQVVRPNTPKTAPLRAWSAADKMVIDHLGVDNVGRLLVVNDEFGALSVALAAFDPELWGDSALSRAAIDANLVANGLSAAGSRHIAGDLMPEGEFDTIVVRVPKTTALLDHQLNVLSSRVAPDARIVGTGMARHIHKTTLASFERHIGPTTTSRAERKARLIHVEVASDRVGAPLAAPVAFTGFTTARGVRVAELPGTFSGGHVDIGSAALLDVLADVSPPESGSVVVDLGCGNGVLAATAAAWWPGCSFVLSDVSDLAVAAAAETWARNGLEPSLLTTVAADGLDDVESASVDVVVTNPPFHQGHALDAPMTERLLADVRRVLTADGVAYVVAQRHLNMHTRMHQWFDSVEVLSKHPSHVVLAAKKPRGG